MSTTSKSRITVDEPGLVNPLRVQKATQLIIVTLQDGTRIRGKVHLPQSGRLSDLMNHQAGERPFLAMTDAVIRLPDGSRHSSPFLSVNRHCVTTAFPTEEKPVQRGS